MPPALLLVAALIVPGPPVDALTHTTPFRDRWIRVSDEWKVKSREQIGAPSESVGKPE